MKYILVLLAAALMAYGSMVEGSDSTKVRVKGDTIYYLGELQGTANQRVKKLYDRARHKPIWLEIDSHGGEITQGIELGRWVFRHQLGVRVTKVCNANCANYVFPAGRAKVLAKHASLGFNVGAPHVDFEGLEFNTMVDDFVKAHPDQDKVTRKQIIVDGVRVRIEELRQLEETYYLEIDVSPRLSSWGLADEYAKFGMQDQAGIQLWFRDEPEKGVFTMDEDEPVYAGWYYTPEDMAELGVTGVQVTDPPWEPPEVTSTDQKLFWVKVSGK